jgi:hypothetical protein
MYYNTPEDLHHQLERMFRQASAMLDGSGADAALGMQLLNQIAIAAEAGLTRRRATDTLAHAKLGGSSGSQYCGARR